MKRLGYRETGVEGCSRRWDRAGGGVKRCGRRVKRRDRKFIPIRDGKGIDPDDQG